MKVRKNHPVQEFLFYIADLVSNHDIEEVNKLVNIIANSRNWTIKSPEFIYEREEDYLNKGDEPLVTLGGILQIYSALPPYKLPIEIDQAHFEEINFIIEKLIDFSSDTGHIIQLELDGVYVGSIDHGQPNENITIGLLGEWEKALKTVHKSKGSVS